MAIQLVIRRFLPTGEQVIVRPHGRPEPDWVKAVASWKFQSLIGQRLTDEKARFQIIAAVRDGQVTAIDCDQAAAELAWAALRASR